MDHGDHNNSNQSIRKHNLSNQSADLQHQRKIQQMTKAAEFAKENQEQEHKFRMIEKEKDQQHEKDMAQLALQKSQAKAQAYTAKAQAFLRTAADNQTAKDIQSGKKRYTLEI